MMHADCCRLIKHTEKLLEEKEEKLCVKVLRTLREMMAIDSECGEKVTWCLSSFRSVLQICDNCSVVTLQI
jgi:hypothetical protein